MAVGVFRLGGGRSVERTKTIWLGYLFRMNVIFLLEPLFYGRRFAESQKQHGAFMHSIRTAPKTGELLLLNMASYGDNDWCVVGYFHKKRGWVLASDLTCISPVGWERYHAPSEQRLLLVPA